jgi:hypothetical protein
MTERPVLLAEITGRIGRERLSVVAPSDFSTGPWREHGAGSLDGFVPYCLDMRARRTLYVRAGNRAALLRAPLQYVHLRERATTIASVPWERGRVGAGPQPPGCFVFSVGRCGSTLLVEAMRRGGALALSEPDFYTQAVAARIHAGRVFPGYARLEDVLGGLTADLLVACGAEGPTPTLIKLRTECCKAPALIVGTAKSAPATLFMIRSFKPWLVSTLRVSKHPPRTIVERYIEGLRCFAWLRRNTECTLVGYEDLTADPVAALQNVASALGAPLDSARVRAALKSDAQSGTALAQARLVERELPAELVDRTLELWMEARPKTLLAELGLAE